MQRLQMPWGRTAYSQTPGAGVPLLFLHGTSCDSSDWEHVLSSLPDGWRCICMDFRGHGQSDAPENEFTLDDVSGDVLALIDRLGVGRAVLVGHSLGGIVAMHAAAKSEAIAGLILLEGWTDRNAGESFVGDRLYGNLDRGAIERIQEKDCKTRRRFPGHVWRHFSDSVASFDGFGYLQGADIPICEVYGDMGRTSSSLESLRIPDNPQIEIVWIPAAGHYLPHERPAEVAEICARFGGRVAQAAGP